MIETPQNFSRRAKIKGGLPRGGGFTPNCSVEVNAAATAGTTAQISNGNGMNYQRHRQAFSTATVDMVTATVEHSNGHRSTDPETPTNPPDDLNFCPCLRGF